MADSRNQVEMLLHWADKTPAERWLIQPVEGNTRSYTWAEAAAQVRSMASALREMNLEPGARIAISGRNTAHWFLADLAIAMAGYVSIGLYPKQSAAAVRYIFEHSETRVLFLGPMPDHDEFLSAVPGSVKTIAFPYPETPRGQLQWDELVKTHAPMQNYPAPPPDTLATLVYTSGTTGNPKGVMISFGNAAWGASQMLEVTPARGKERFFSYLPLAHMFERGAVELTSLYLGGEVHFLENLEKLAEQLKETAPTRFFGVPLVYNRIQAGILRKMPQEKLDRLLRIPLLSMYIKHKIKQGVGLQNARYLFVGAAPMPISLMQWFQKLGITVLQGYGMTENSIYATASLPHANKLGAVGKALPGANLRISEEGEILFKHPGVMAGYYREPEKTRETFTADGYLRTGDRGRIDEEGYLFITGRVKDIFKTQKGKYISPAPIEGQLAKNLDIDQLCLVGAGLKQPLMLITLAVSAKGKAREQLESGLLADMEDVNKNLEAHEQIAKLVVLKDAWTIDNGMMTPTMKVKRNEVEKRYAELIEKEGATRSAIAWES